MLGGKKTNICLRILIRPSKLNEDGLQGSYLKGGIPKKITILFGNFSQMALNFHFFHPRRATSILDGIFVSKHRCCYIITHNICPSIQMGAFLFPNIDVVFNIYPPIQIGAFLFEKYRRFYNTCQPIQMGTCLL